MRLLLLIVLLCLSLAHAKKLERRNNSPKATLAVGEKRQSNTWIVHLKQPTNPLEWGKLHGLRFDRRLKGFTDHYVFKTSLRQSSAVPSHSDDALKARLHEDKAVVWFEQQGMRRHSTRSKMMSPPHMHKHHNRKQVKKPAVRHYLRAVESKQLANMSRRWEHAVDPEYWRQWHLHGSLGSSIHVNAEVAWRAGAMGQGVRVAIVDDGCNYNNRDLTPNFESTYSWNWNGGNGDPSPYISDSHGTAAAGVCCAAQNDVCGSGVAPNATLVCLKLIADGTADYMEAEAMGHSNEQIRIYSNSWGPVDDANRLEGPGVLTKAALRRGYTNNGIVYVWAGGNGLLNGDNGNYDSYANSIYTLAVGAHDSLGKQAWYSEPCACLFVSAPSSGQTHAITTTDLQGSYGATPGDCRYDFGGTSSAAPLVAGVIANLMSLYPHIRVREAQHILARGAVKIDPSYRDWSRNSRHYHHSHAYGFGHVEMHSLLEVARSYANRQIEPMVSWKSALFDTRTLIPKRNWSQYPRLLSDAGNPLVIPFEGPPLSTMDFLEQVEVDIRFKHAHRGQVRLSLLSPEGIVSQLALRHNDNHRDLPFGTWVFTTVRHWGEFPQGEWKLLLDDVGTGSAGHVVSVQLYFHGLLEHPIE